MKANDNIRTGGRHGAGWAYQQLQHYKRAKHAPPRKSLITLALERVKAEEAERSQQRRGENGEQGQ